MVIDTPRSRLEQFLEKVPGGPDSVVLQAQMQADVKCAIEIIETMGRLTVAVNDMANRSEAASIESGKVAAESAKLSRQLNRLTIFVVIAAIVSALAAGLQAWAAWYTATTN
jgi:hypothetical protein